MLCSVLVGPHSFPWINISYPVHNVVLICILVLKLAELFVANIIHWAHNIFLLFAKHFQTSADF